MANKTKTGVNIIKTGYNKLLKFLKNKIFIFNFELKLNKKNGANPTNIIFEHADNAMNLKEGIVSSIKELLNNHQNVILIYPIPEVGWHVPKELFKQKKSYLITRHFDPVTTSYDVYKKRSKESF